MAQVLKWRRKRSKRRDKSSSKRLATLKRSRPGSPENRRTLGDKLQVMALRRPALLESVEQYVDTLMRRFKL